MKRAVLVTLLALAAMPLPVRAQPAGCVALTAKCSYRATGPSQYVADGLSGWYLQVFRDGAMIHQREGDFGWPQTGTLATIPGDTVTLGLTVGVPGGFLAAGSELPAQLPVIRQGCWAGGYNGNTQSIQCKYRATGPGTWAAPTGWPYLIKATRDGVTWRTLVYEPNFGRPGRGTLATEAGDMVHLSISCWNDGKPCRGEYNPFLHMWVYEGSRAGAIVAFDD